MPVTELYTPDTPEGRAVAQVAASLSDGAEPGQLSRARKLARIAALAMTNMVGGDAASLFFIGLSRDCLRARGCGEGSKRARG
jgi:hypothetical protein